MIHLHNLAKFYGTQPIFRDLNITITKGERVALLGQNGSGKSTLIRMICGLIEPTAGSICVFDKIPWKNRRSIMPNIGLVLGGTSLLDSQYTIQHNFEMHRILYNLPKETFENTLNTLTNTCQLTSLMSKYPQQCSLGEKMRVELALSLLHRPVLLILDEPSIGLDPLAKSQLQYFIKKLCESQQITLFLTSHDMSDIEILCERALILHNHSFVFDGSIKEFKKQLIKEQRVRIRVFPEIPVTSIPFNIQELGPSYYEIPIQPEELPRLITDLQKYTQILELSIDEPNLNDLLCQIYGS